ncbi:MAG TPA: alpha-L-arabinofuranosidase C-terminal domain-containing protein, partial [Paludibacter sp.]
KEVRKVSYTFNGLKASDRKGTHSIFISKDMDAENTLDNSNAVVPTEKAIRVSGNVFEVELAPQSFNLYSIKL